MARRGILAAGLLVITTLASAGAASAATRARFSAPVEAFVGSVPFRVAVADLNGDGIPDLATADNGARGASVLLGRGDGSFRPRTAVPTSGRPLDIAAATQQDPASVPQLFAILAHSADLALTPSLTAKDVKGWDSFKQIEIIMASEEKWGIKFNTRELYALRCVGDLASMIGTKAH